MSRRVVFALFVILCASIAYQATAGMPAGRPGGRAGGSQAAPQKPLVVPEGYEKVLVTVEFRDAGRQAAPAKGPSAGKQGAREAEPKAESGAAGRGGRRGGMMGGHGASCPQTQVGQMLGIALSQPHGCIVGSVLPNGRGAKAGIKPGDSIVEADGKTVTCPSVLAPCLQRTAQPGKVKLTILRRKQEAKAAGKPAAKGAPAKSAKNSKGK